MAVALDSDAVIAFLDRSDGSHEAADSRVRELLTQGAPLYVSAVTYAEVLTGAKLGYHDEALVHGFFDDLVSKVVPIDADVAQRAAELRGQRKALKLPDALILAGADLDSEVELLLCSDEVAEKLAHLLSCDVESLASSD